MNLRLGRLAPRRGVPSRDSFGRPEGRGGQKSRRNALLNYFKFH